MVEPFLVGPRVRLRLIEREDLPRYRELSESVQLNLLAGAWASRRARASYSAGSTRASSTSRTGTSAWLYRRKGESRSGTWR